MTAELKQKKPTFSRPKVIRIKNKSNTYYFLLTNIKIKSSFYLDPTLHNFLNYVKGDPYESKFVSAGRVASVK